MGLICGSLEEKLLKWKVSKRNIDRLVRVNFSARIDFSSEEEIRLEEIEHIKNIEPPQEKKLDSHKLELNKIFDNILRQFKVSKNQVDKITLVQRGFVLFPVGTIQVQPTYIKKKSFFFQSGKKSKPFGSTFKRKSFHTVYFFSVDFACLLGGSSILKCLPSVSK